MRLSRKTLFGLAVGVVLVVVAAWVLSGRFSTADVLSDLPPSTLRITGSNGTFVESNESNGNQTIQIVSGTNITIDWKCFTGANQMIPTTTAGFYEPVNAWPRNVANLTTSGEFVVSNVTFTETYAMECYGPNNAYEYRSVNVVVLNQGQSPYVGSIGAPVGAFRIFGSNGLMAESTDESNTSTIQVPYGTNLLFDWNCGQSGNNITIYASGIIVHSPSSWGVDGAGAIGLAQGARSRGVLSFVGIAHSMSYGVHCETHNYNTNTNTEYNRIINVVVYGQGKTSYSGTIGATPGMLRIFSDTGEHVETTDTTNTHTMFVPKGGQITMDWNCRDLSGTIRPKLSSIDQVGFDNTTVTAGVVGIEPTSSDTITLSCVKLAGNNGETDPSSYKRSVNVVVYDPAEGHYSGSIGTSVGMFRIFTAKGAVAETSDSTVPVLSIPKDSNVTMDWNCANPISANQNTVSITASDLYAFFTGTKSLERSIWDTPFNRSSLVTLQCTSQSFNRSIQVNICGDGTKQTNEQCDDGNNTSSDGCSATCQTEAGASSSAISSISSISSVSSTASSQSSSRSSTVSVASSASSSSSTPPSSQSSSRSSSASSASVTVTQSSSSNATTTTVTSSASSSASYIAWSMPPVQSSSKSSVTIFFPNAPASSSVAAKTISSQASSQLFTIPFPPVAKQESSAAAPVVQTVSSTTMYLPFTQTYTSLPPSFGPVPQASQAAVQQVAEQPPKQAAPTSAPTVVTPTQNPSLAQPQSSVPTLKPGPTAYTWSTASTSHSSLPSYQLSLQGDCGNGVQEVGEQCDRGTKNSDAPNALCRTNCTLSRCGDSIVDSKYEQCDDGQRNSDQPGAHCPSNCGVVDNRGQTLAANTFDLPVALQNPSSRVSQNPFAFEPIHTAAVNLYQYPTVLNPLSATLPAHAPVGATGPGSLAAMAAGAASGIALVRRKRNKK